MRSREEFMSEVKSRAAEMAAIEARRKAARKRRLRSLCSMAACFLVVIAATLLVRLSGMGGFDTAETPALTNGGAPAPTESKEIAESTTKKTSLRIPMSKRTTQATTRATTEALCTTSLPHATNRGSLLKPGPSGNYYFDFGDRYDTLGITVSADSVYELEGDAILFFAEALAAESYLVYSDYVPDPDQSFEYDMILSQNGVTDKLSKVSDGIVRINGAYYTTDTSYIDKLIRDILKR